MRRCHLPPRRAQLSSGGLGAAPVARVDRGLPYHRAVLLAAVAYLASGSRLSALSSWPGWLVSCGATRWLAALVFFGVIGARPLGCAALLRRPSSRRSRSCGRAKVPSPTRSFSPVSRPWVSTHRARLRATRTSPGRQDVDEARRLSAALHGARSGVRHSRSTGDHPERSSKAMLIAADRGAPLADLGTHRVDGAPRDAGVARCSRRARRSHSRGARSRRRIGARLVGRGTLQSRGREDRLGGGGGARRTATKRLAATSLARRIRCRRC